jgi:KDO2-lipid IV(A) lauroyltransferase
VKAPRPLRHSLEDALIGAAAFAVGLLPRRAMLKLGGALGGLLSDLDRRHTGIAADGLRRSFPEWDEARVRRTARAVYEHFGRVLLDILWLQRRSREEVLALADASGVEACREVLAQGRGALMLTGHVGNWEVAGLLIGWLLQPSGVVGRPLDNPRLDRRITAFRARAGNEPVPKWDALRHVMKRIRGGGSAAFLIDQNVQAQDGIFVDFFGRPACTTTVAAALGLRLGAPVITGYCLLTPEGRYRMVFDPPRSLESTGHKDEDVRRETQAFTTQIEGWIRSAPEQWLWMHRRWHTRPPGESA